MGPQPRPKAGRGPGQTVLMSSKAKARVGKLIQSKIRSVLNERWAPIGGAAEHEYDFCIGSLYKLIREQAAEQEIARLLSQFEQRLLGQPETSDARLTEIAQALLSLDLPSVSQ